MIEIAHLDHRDALMEAAKKLGYVPREQYLGSQGAYPVHEERRLALAKGSEVPIRPAHAADADAIRNLFHSLSPDESTASWHRPPPRTGMDPGNWSRNNQALAP